MSGNLKGEFLVTKMNELLGDYLAKYRGAYKKSPFKVNALNEKLEKQIKKTLMDYEVYKERNKK